MAVFFPSVPVKYNSGTTLNNSVSQNKISFGINNINYGPSSQTGWYGNVTDAFGNPYPFTIISDTYSLGYVGTESESLPTFWGTTGSTNNDLLNMINNLDERIGQPSFSALTDAITWIEGTQKYTIQNRFYEDIVTSNLRRCYDAGFTASYPLVNSSWYDISGNDSTATLNNTIFDTDSGGVFEFNGTNANAQIGQPLENNTNYSINAWIFSTSNVGARNICSTQDSPFWVSNGVLYGGVGGDYTVTSYTSIPLNEWVNVGLTFDDASGTMNLYVNGTLVDTNTTSSHFTKQDMYIGSHFSGGIAVSFFQGFIGHVSLYDGVISDVDVIQNYNSLAPRFSVSPLPTPTPTMTSTVTPTNTPSVTQTQTPTNTQTQTPTTTLTSTPTPSITNTSTPAVTPTNTSTPTPTGTPGAFVVTGGTGTAVAYTTGSYFNAFTSASGVTTTDAFNSNNGCWQLYYSHSAVTINQGTNRIGLNSYNGGGNSWSWSISISNSNNTIGNWGSVSAMTAIESFTYAAGGFNYSNLNQRTVTIPANRYFLIQNNGGPFYRTIKTLASNRTAQISGTNYVTVCNKVALGDWPSGGTTAIPTQFGGSGGGYTFYTGAVHVHSIIFG